MGAHGHDAFSADARTRRSVKGEPKLERTYWFLRSEVWFLEPWQATKRLIDALGELRHYWTPEIEDEQAAALRWMYAETISILTLQLIALVGRYQASDAQVSDIRVRRKQRPRSGRSESQCQLLPPSIWEERSHPVPNIQPSRCDLQRTRHLARRNPRLPSRARRTSRSRPRIAGPRTLP